MHSRSPAVIPFGVSRTALRPLYHMSGFLGAGAPRFEIRDAAGPATDMLIRTRELGHALAAALGSHPVMLMRGHGSVAVGPSVRQAAFRAVCTEVNARMGSEALRLGDVTFLNEQEAAQATATNAALVDRPWELWRKRVAVTMNFGFSRRWGGCRLPWFVGSTAELHQPKRPLLPGSQNSGA